MNALVSLAKRKKPTRYTPPEENPDADDLDYGTSVLDLILDLICVRL